jgi:hypothetical protein
MTCQCTYTENKLRNLSLQSELYRQSDRRLSAKLMSPSLRIWGVVVSAADLYGRFSVF